MQRPEILQSVKAQRPGYTLNRNFYICDSVFEHEVSWLFPRNWLLIDHGSRIPDAGDYFTLNLFGDSVIVIRGRNGDIHAHYNLCRHRGSQICEHAEGNVNRLTCPYHAWTYDLDGTLRAARLMPEGFVKSQHNLKSLHAREHDGLIFLNTASGTPPDFDGFIEPLRPFLQIHGLENAKVAHRQLYPALANWKLVIENFFECYHCAPSHPELTTVHSRAKLLALGAGPGSGPAEAMAEFQSELDRWADKARGMGHYVGAYNDEDPGSFRAAMRVPIRDGFLSETEDGTPAATLMGDFKDFDGGQTTISFNPLGTLLMSNDFAVLFRFTPVTVDKTDMEILWLANAATVDAGDFDLEKLTWAWDVTTKQDKKIIEFNNAGVMSRQYEPGPYSRQEEVSKQLVEWYLRSISA